MYKLGKSKSSRVIISLLVTAIILSSVVSFPTSVEAISVTQSTPNTSYLLGATVPLPADINFDPADAAPIQQVTLDIQGPQAASVNLPFAPGAFSITTLNSGIVSGTVSWDNVGYSSGYGYGYGPNPAGPSRIRYNPLNWRPPVLKTPPPPSPGPSLPGWQGLFDIPGNWHATGAGYDSANNRLYVTADGPMGQPDQVLVLNATSGALISSFNLPGDMSSAADYVGSGSMPGLYVADTNWYPDASSGKIFHYQSGQTTPHHSFPTSTQIGGLAFDGINLLAGAQNMGQLLKFNPDPSSFPSGQLSNSSGVASGSPVTLQAFTDNVVTILNPGTFNINLPVNPAGASGTANSGTADVAGGSQPLFPGANFISVLNPGTISVQFSGPLTVGPPIFLDNPPGVPPFFGGPLMGSQGLAFYGATNNLLWSIGDKIARINMAAPNPVVQNFETLNPALLVGGMAMVGDYAYMAGNDIFNPGQQRIFKARHPGAPPLDTTVAGSYTARITVTGSLLAQGPVVNFALKKIGDAGMPAAVNVTINSPSDESAVQSTSVPVSGTVNDPSIAEVSVGAAIGATEYIRDKVENVVVPAGSVTTDIWQPGGMWHVTTDRSLQKSSPTAAPVATIMMAGEKSWAYNQANQFGGPPNYDNGQHNSGFLETKTGRSVGGKSSLSFWTGWNTEPPAQFDKKTIEAFVDGAWQPVAQIVEAGFFGVPMFGPPPGFGGPVLMVWGVDNAEAVVDASAGLVQVQVPQFTWKHVVLDFKNRFNGKNIKLRFAFDTMDQYANMMEGWYIDNIIFKAESSIGGQSATVGPDLSWSTTVTIGEGANPITVVAVSGYYDALGGPSYLTATDTNTVYLDTTAPVVTIDAVTSPTSSATQAVTGAVVDSNIDTITMTQVSDGGTKPYTTPTLTTTSTGKTFSQSVNLVAGTNTMTVTATDKAGLSATATATIVYDIVPPTITAGATLYPVGEVSARTSDFFVFQADASDFGIGVADVQLLGPYGGQSAPAGVTDNTTEQTGTDGKKYQKISGTWYNLISFKKATDIPQAVRTQWGVSGDVTNRWLMPMNLPTSAPPGTYTMTARAKDGGGNTATATVSGQVVSTLSNFNVYLMPDWNLIATPLIPTNTSMGTVMTGLQAKGLQSVWYYNTATNTWLSYDPSSQANSLTTFEAGKGYWVRMDSTAFAFDPPLAPGLPDTPRPVKLTVSGQVLQAGNQPPPTYAIKAGWNLIGLHNERDSAVSTALSGLTSPYGAKLWASLLEYKNFITYPTQQGQEPETVLGAFSSVGAAGTMNPGKGYWLFASADGTIVP